MKWSDGIRIAFSTLIENPLRTFLTLLGIAIGVTAVVLVISVIEGLNLYVADTVSDLGPQVFVLEQFGIIKGHKEWVRALRRNKDLTPQDADAIRRQATLVEKVGLTQHSGTTVKRGSEKIPDCTVEAVSAESPEIEPYDTEMGRPFAPAEVARAAYVVYLGYDIAQTLFPRVDPIGRKVSVWGRSFWVVGVGAQKGSVFGQSRDNYVKMPITTFWKIHGLHGSVTVMVKARNANRVPEAIDEVRSIMRARHHVRYNEEDDFGIISASALMDFWKDLTGMIFRVAIFIVSISLVVGGIVIMNIMLLTVVERTREIGVRKAVGARQRDIQFQFLVESIILCALGGVIGVTLAYLATVAVRAMTPLPARFPLWAPILAVGVTSVVGIFFGIHPARQAARLDPIEALRTEET